MIDKETISAFLDRAVAAINPDQYGPWFSSLKSSPVPGYDSKTQMVQRLGKGVWAPSISIDWAPSNPSTAQIIFNKMRILAPIGGDKVIVYFKELASFWDTELQRHCPELLRKDIMTELSKISFSVLDTFRQYNPNIRFSPEAIAVLAAMDCWLIDHGWNPDEPYLNPFIRRVTLETDFIAELSAYVMMLVRDREGQLRRSEYGNHPDATGAEEKVKSFSDLTAYGRSISDVLVKQDRAEMALLEFKQRFTLSGIENPLTLHFQTTSESWKGKPPIRGIVLITPINVFFAPFDERLTADQLAAIIRLTGVDACGWFISDPNSDEFSWLIKENRLLIVGPRELHIVDLINFNNTSMGI